MTRLRDFHTHKCDFDIHECEYNTQECNFGVISTRIDFVLFLFVKRVSEITTLTRVYSSTKINVRLPKKTGLGSD
jgi:hypothetical protein